jgi:hypothetical protein
MQRPPLLHMLDLVLGGVVGRLPLALGVCVLARLSVKVIRGICGVVGRLPLALGVCVLALLSVKVRGRLLPIEHMEALHGLILFRKHLRYQLACPPLLQ